MPTQISSNYYYYHHIMSPAKVTAMLEAERRARIQKEAFQLRQVRHSMAPKVAQLARIAAMATKKLLKLHACMDEAARQIAGKEYRECHEVSFEEFPSIADQLKEDGFVSGAGLQDVLSMATEMARWAGECASAAEPPQLPSE